MSGSGYRMVRPSCVAMYGTPPLPTCCRVTWTYAQKPSIHDLEARLAPLEGGDGSSCPAKGHRGIAALVSGGQPSQTALVISPGQQLRAPRA